MPEFNEIRCMACRNCVNLCKKLGPDVLEIVDGVAIVARPEDCIGDGACMISCPARAIFIMSSHNPEDPLDTP